MDGLPEYCLQNLATAGGCAQKVDLKKDTMHFCEAVSTFDGKIMLLIFYEASRTISRNFCPKSNSDTTSDEF